VGRVIAKRENAEERKYKENEDEEDDSEYEGDGMDGERDGEELAEDGNESDDDFQDGYCEHESIEDGYEESTVTDNEHEEYDPDIEGAADYEDYGDFYDDYGGKDDEGYASMDDSDSFNYRVYEIYAGYLERGDDLDFNATNVPLRNTLTKNFLLKHGARLRYMSSNTAPTMSETHDDVLPRSKTKSKYPYASQISSRNTPQITKYVYANVLPRDVPLRITTSKLGLPPTQGIG
jgi:hypothetical protein